MAPPRGQKKLYFMKYFKKNIHKINTFLLEMKTVFLKIVIVFVQSYHFSVQNWQFLVQNCRNQHELFHKKEIEFFVIFLALLVLFFLEVIGTILTIVQDPFSTSREYMEFRCSFSRVQASQSNLTAR